MPISLIPGLTWRLSAPPFRLFAEPGRAGERRAGHETSNGTGGVGGGPVAAACRARRFAAVTSLLSALASMRVAILTVL